MKLTVEDMKKTIEWIRVNSNDLYVTIDIVDRKMYWKLQDKHGVQVEIKLYEESGMMAKITRETNL